jgi:general secretion pathway protein G
MQSLKNKKAFTMIELVFVIVVIGILAGVAIPRLAATRDDAELTKGKTVLASIRSALSIERQKRILRGAFAPITAIGSGGTVFGNFWEGTPAVDTGIPVLEYPEPSTARKYYWKRVDNNNTYFCLSNTCSDNNNSRIKFQLNAGRFICKDGACDMLGAVLE